MKSGTEEIRDSKELIAIIFRKAISVSGVQFFTPKDNNFQIGIHDRAKGVRLGPHIHKLDHPITITSIQEVLVVQKGKIRLSLYSVKGKKLRGVLLSGGDSVLLVAGGHGVDFLSATRMFEIKQGPYPGSSNAKIYLS